MRLNLSIINDCFADIMNNKQETITEKIYHQIRSDIITCTYTPGQQISQMQIVNRYEVGVTPVREALVRLTQDGLIQSIPRFGYIISPISITDVNHMYELRAILEPASARIASKLATQEELEQIMKSADFSYCPGDKQSIINFVNKNSEFHLSIAHATGNSRIIDVISNTLDEMARLFFLGLNFSEMTKEAHAEHHSIATAIYNRNPEKAEKISREEIMKSKTRILNALNKR